MKAQKSKKKSWKKPAIQTLKVRKDTSGGISIGPEGAGNYFGPPGPPGTS
ncbi:MAG: hypothetical protein IH594_14680 [Bacteroidales bacterium]|nr:hypothetical protein [Bacteroidales bacterium]